MEINADILQEVKHDHLDVMFDELSTFTHGVLDENNEPIRWRFSELFGFNPLFLYNKSQLRINYIMFEFDFYKVQKVMGALDWGWFYTSRPPSISDLKKNARKYLNEVAKDHRPSVSRGSGGFRASKRPSGEFSDLYLEFIVESMDSEFTEESGF